MPNLSPDNALFGRSWQLTIVSGGFVYTIKSMDFTAEAMRVKFYIDYPGYMAFYFSQFEIYNLSEEIVSKLIQDRVGAKVYFEAGYQKGFYGLIFSGTCYQVMYERENVTDYKLTLNCLDGKGLLDNNFVAGVLGAGYNKVALMNLITSKAQKAIEVEGVSPTLLADKTQMPRAATVFYTPFEGIREVVRGGGNNVPATATVTNDKLSIRSLVDSLQGDAIVVSPATGLIGTPIQTQFGANFRVLLDPRIRIAYPPRWIKLDNSQIRAARVQLNQPLSMLDDDGNFLIAGVKHMGDTRGNDWYTDVTGLNLAGKLDARLAGGVDGMVPTLIKEKTEK